MCSDEEIWPPDNHVMYHGTTCTAADMLLIVVAFDVFLLPAMQTGADFVVDNTMSNVSATAGPPPLAQYPAIMSSPLTTATSRPQGSTGYSTRVARLLHYQQPAYYFYVKNLQIHVAVFVLCFTYVLMTSRQQQYKQLEPIMSILMANTPLVVVTEQASQLTISIKVFGPTATS